MDYVREVCRCCFKQARVEATPYYCIICFEEGKLRACCKTVYCDYDYSKNGSCPNCQNASKVDKITGQVLMIAPYSEHEECRICLGPGLKRRCCGNYYCDDCYCKIYPYMLIVFPLTCLLDKFPKCRSCDKNTSNRGLNQQLRNQASLVTVIMGWLLTAFIFMAAIAVIAVLVVNELATPQGLFDYKCYGFFTECGTRVCVDVDASVTSGSYGSLPSLYNWRKCDLDSKSKLQAQACIFDQEMFDLTNGWLGYDVCKDEFEGGAYVFEDTFEHWRDIKNFSTNAMVSATWAETNNVETNNYCGTAEELGGKRAMVFSGEFYRFAETGDVDIFFGGWLEAELFIAPVGHDVKYPKCKTAYTGHVSIEYSINGGTTWTLLEHYPAWKYRREKFFPIRLEVPSDGHTTKTRFRFIQKVFEAERDAWALDNVRVFHKFQSSWKTEGAYQQAKKETNAPMQFAQCCFDTEWCETRLSESDLAKYEVTNYQLRGTELFICLAVFLSLVKFCYLAAMDWFMKRRLPFNDELDHFNQLDKLIALLPPHLRPKKTMMNHFNEVHEAARADRKMRGEMGDGLAEETEEEAVKRKQEEEKLKATILANKRKKEKMKKKIAKMKKRKETQAVDLKNAKRKKAQKAAWINPEEVAPEVLVPGMDFLEDEEKSDDGEFGFAEMREDDALSVDSLGSAGVEKGQDEAKKDTSLLLAVDISDDPGMRFLFAMVVLGMFILCFLYKSSTQADYTLEQELLVYGKYHEKISIVSGGILFFAMVCDFKEIYLTLKSIIPVTKSLIPPVTLDTAFDVNALFIGNKIVSLEDIREAHTFESSFIVLSIVGYFLGCFPWCMFSMIIRDQYLSFDTMRFITPMLGAIIILRAILGPSFVLKSAYAFSSVFNLTLKGREDMGVAFKAKKTLTSALNMAIGMACGGSLLLSIVALNIAQLAFGVFFLVGFCYGAVSGCSHELPVRPWMCITKISDGVWLKLKEKRRCPCVYWGAYCSDMHDAYEVFVIFPKDQVLFLSKLKGGSDAAV